MTTTETFLTPETAQALTRKLRPEHGRVHAEVRDGRIHFVGSPTGEHSLSISASTEERVVAHWQGYAESAYRRGGACARREEESIAARLAVGDEVAFIRGMFGYWHGTVEHLGQRKTGNRVPFAIVRFRRVNGSIGRLRVEIPDLTLTRRAAAKEK